MFVHPSSTPKKARKIRKKPDEKIKKKFFYAFFSHHQIWEIKSIKTPVLLIFLQCPFKKKFKKLILINYSKD